MWIKHWEILNKIKKQNNYLMKNILIVFALISVIAACSSGKSSDKKAELEKLKKEQADLQEKITKLQAELAASGNIDANVKPKEIAVTAAAYQPFVHYVEVQAKVDADENVAVSAEAPGTITKINVKAGDKVSKGAILAELDVASSLKGIEESQNTLDFAKTMYDKRKALWDQKVGSEADYLKAKNDYESAQKRIATLRQGIEMMRIKSPINGTVDAVDIKVGQAVQPGSQAIRVVNLSNLKVKAEVAESYIAKVKQGNEVVMVFPDLDKEVKTKLSYAGKVIDPVNRTFHVEVNVNDKTIDLHPNMVAVLKIADYQSPKALSVPVNLVQSSGESSYIFVAEGNKDKAIAKRRTVTVGRNYNGSIEIISGLNEGDNIITTGYQDLVDGQPVKF